MKSRIEGIDAFRLLAALCVVALHIDIAQQFVAEAAALIRLSCRWAVPFFFIVTGYFLAQKSGPSRAAAPLARAVVIFAMAIVLMLPLAILTRGAPIALSAVLSGDVLLNGGYYHLWFLSSMIIGLLCIFALDQLDIPEWLPVLSIAFLLFFLLGAYHPISDATTDFGRLLSSVPFLYLGMLLSSRSLSMQSSVLLLITGVVLEVLEASALASWRGESTYGYQLLIGTIPFATGAFGVARNLGGGGHVTQVLARWGVRYALGIYIIHPYFSHFIANNVDLGIQHTLMFGILLIPAVFALSLAVLMCIDRLAPVLLDLIAGERTALQRLNVLRLTRQR